MVDPYQAAEPGGESRLARAPMLHWGGQSVAHGLRPTATHGFRPIKEAAIPHGLCFLKLGRGVYTTGFCPDGVWLREHDMMPVDPIAFLDFPDD